MPPGRSYYLHTLDLTPTREAIFQGCHKDCVQRRIRRAEREPLDYEVGRSNRLVDEFYRLLVMTRKRHQVPPQPLAWFRNLAGCMGERLQIRLARKNDVPVAALLTLRHGSSVVYKYGCSDRALHHLGGMPFLFWKLIEESKQSSCEVIDFGRSDLENEGLISFKDRFGARRKRITYLRYPYANGQDVAGGSRLFSMLPAAVLPAVGRIMYRHIG